jgi:hypothetical protein
VVTTPSFTKGLALEGTNVYFQTFVPGGIGQLAVLRVPRDGGTPVPVVAPEDTSWYGFFALADREVYFTDASRLRVVPKTGGDSSRVLFETGSNLGALVIDGDSAYVFAAASIFRVPIDGGSPVALATSEAPVALATDADSVYWVNFRFGKGHAPSALRKIAKSGGEPVTLVDDGSFEPSINENGPSEAYLRLFVDADSVYWGDQANHRVLRCSKTGGAPAVLAAGEQAWAVVSVVVYRGWAYWIEGAGVPQRHIFGVPVSGGTVRQFATVDGTAIPRSALSFSRLSGTRARMRSAWKRRSSASPSSRVKAQPMMQPPTYR